MTDTAPDQASEDTARLTLVERLANVEGASTSYALSLQLQSASSDEHHELMLRKLYIEMRDALNAGDTQRADALSLIVQRLVQLKAFA